MNPALIILALWVLFGGSHLLLASPPARDALVRRLGEERFVLIYSLFAAVSFTVLVLAFGVYHREGASGLTLGRWPLVRGALVALGFAGAMLMVAGLLNYFRSPMAVFRTELRPVRGIEKITRHSFFAGTALLMGAHALLAPALTGAVFFGGFVVLSVGGIVLQDRKLLRRYGEPYARYLESTSAIPFAALLGGRQKVGIEDRLSRMALTGAAGAFGLWLLHPIWLAGYGLPIAVLIAGGGLYIVVRRWSKRPSAAPRPRSDSSVPTK